MHGPDDEGSVLRHGSYRYGLLFATITKDRNVASTRKVNGNQVRCAGASIIFLKRPSQPPCLNPHDGVLLGIEIFPPPEGLDGNRVAFEPGALAAQRRLDDKSKECAQLRRGPEEIAKHHPGERGGNLLPGGPLVGGGGGDSPPANLS